MKRVQMFLAGAFIAVGSLYAQSSDAEWQDGSCKVERNYSVGSGASCRAS